LKIDIKPFKHFSFDLWLTLIRSNVQFKEKRNILFINFFSIRNDFKEVTEIFKKYDDLCTNISIKTGIHFDYKNIYYLILNDVNLNILKISKGQIEEFYFLSEQLFFQFMPELIYPKIGLLLDQIKSEEKTSSILSNTAFIKGNALRKVLNHYDLSQYFSFQLYSDEIGYSKPNELVFKRVFEYSNKFQKVKKSDILHIGDNKYTDFEGAKKFGLSALLVSDL
jgi:putative hydrolase of the HAD superfamily